ncbi:MAG: tRNA (adenosine(37)-N6)-threonylcarbamoyltransferase complex dimerization subunit type 1 TsaB [Candidatus Omnitrophota bacterium]|nr:tRNA (adenosine(37)-N6)-threonylcarbamoyltransferase complex dimerization subunit type 1 TsaB [Candidatus Omnitrophota bacterium]
MKILGIDTSSKFLNIALSEDEDIIEEESHLLDRRQASQLTPIVKELLRKSKTPVSKIDAFVIGLGPGSFTGLRIGVSAIKGFGIVTGKPCIGVASIDAIACNAEESDRDIIPVIDAKRGQVYAAVYRRESGQVKRLSDYMVLPVAKLLKKIKRGPVFLGDGLSFYRENILSADKKAVFLQEKYWYPGAGNLIRLGFSRIRKAKKTGLDKLTPLYLYPDDCQVRKS